MDAKDYMKLPYTVLVKQEKSERGLVFIAIAAELPGCTCIGATPEEVERGILKAMELWFHTRLAAGAPIPKPLPKEIHGNMPVPDERHRYNIRVSLPLSREGFETGEGEKVWVAIDGKTRNAWASEVEGGTYSGLLISDSVFYPDLRQGDAIFFELRRGERPVAFIDGFLERYRLASDAEVRAVIEAIETQSPEPPS